MLKKIVAILLVCLLLCGCSVNEVLDKVAEKLPEKTYEHGDISISLPTTFMNYSKQDVAEGKDFLFANSEMGLTGIKEEKKELFEAFGQMDIEGYANLIAELYEMDNTPTKKGGYWTVTYEQEIDGENWTYMCVFHETSSAYWNIQAYCKSEDFAENEETLFGYATDIKIADNGETEEDPTEPDSTEPEATEPEATEPEVTEPEVTEPEATELKKGVLTLDCPSGFQDYTDTEVAGDYAFMYMSNEIGILGVQENKEELFAYFEEMDLEGYANLIAELYGLDSIAEQYDGVWSIAYSSESSGTNFTYVCAFYETEADFWNIQGYCETDKYEELGEDIWQYITSVEFSEN